MFALSFSSLSLSSPSALPPAPAPGETETDRWHRQADLDYTLCRSLADRYSARLERSLRSQRVGWEKAGHAAYGVLLPDPLPRSGTEEEWYVYYVWGETLLRRTRAEREQRRMLVLAECADDWAELLRQAVHRQVADSRYQIVPEYTDALGETENVPCGFRFTLSAHAPGAIRASEFSLTGQGDTPEDAARDACRRWMETQKISANGE